MSGEVGASVVPRECAINVRIMDWWASSSFVCVCVCVLSTKQMHVMCNQTFVSKCGQQQQQQRCQEARSVTSDKTSVRAPYMCMVDFHEKLNHPLIFYVRRE